MRIVEQVLMRVRVALAVGVALLRRAAGAMIYRAGDWTAPLPRRRRQ